jgi:hypothetical protein
MERKERFALYEKLYFNELDRREKISTRLALPFAVLVATASLLSFMLNSGTMPKDGNYGISFWVLFLSACSTLAIGAWFFRKAWFGHTDKLLPTASDIEAYYEELLKTYMGYEKSDELVKSAFDSFLFSHYAQFSSENAINNDQRSYNIYRSTVSLTVSVLLSFAASVPFFLAKQEVPNDQTRSSASATTSTSRP